MDDLIPYEAAAALIGIEPKRLLGRMIRNKLGDPRREAIPARFQGSARRSGFQRRRADEPIRKRVCRSVRRMRATDKNDGVQP